MAKDTRLSLKQGITDPTVKNRLLIPASRPPKKFSLQGLTRPVHASVEDVTYYRFNPKRQRVECLVSLTPDGWYIAWDNCGICGRYYTKCKCLGIAPTHGILHLLGRRDKWDAISRSAARAQFTPKPKGRPLPPVKLTPPTQKSLNLPALKPVKKAKPLPKLTRTERRLVQNDAKPLPPMKLPKQRSRESLYGPTVNQVRPLPSLKRALP